jgi:hypothetical protein
MSPARRYTGRGELLFVDAVVPIWMVATARSIRAAKAVRTGRAGRRRFGPGVTGGTEIRVVSVAVEDVRPTLFALLGPHGFRVPGKPQTGRRDTLDTGHVT